MINPVSKKLLCLIFLLLGPWNVLIGKASAQQLDILVLGSTSSFDSTREQSFNPTAIVTELQQILINDSAITDTVNLVFEDSFRIKESVKTDLSTTVIVYFDFYLYSLSQYHAWPDDRENRLANIRGEAGTSWDYVVIMHDPFLMGYMPGVYAEGVKIMVDEIKKGPAQPILLMQWPESDSSFSIADFVERAYRVGDSLQIPVVPGAQAWDSLSPKDSSSSHPTPDGSYLAASAIYSEIFNRSASGSNYTYADAIADHAHNTVVAMKSATHYTGRFRDDNVFSMKSETVKKRLVSFNHTGTSTERGIESRFETAMGMCKVSHNELSGLPPFDPKVDVNFGRGNTVYEEVKQYKVDPLNFGRAYGFPMSGNHDTAQITMLYGIDKRYRHGGGYYDGTDLGIAWDMIRQSEVQDDIRALPIRLMWSKIHNVRPDLPVLSDHTHMAGYLHAATGAFMYTSLSGRCPIGDEPDPANDGAWTNWLGRKIGYETAWRMEYLSARVPGFEVLPSSASATDISPMISEKMTVRFLYAPLSPVTVNVSVTSDTAVTRTTQSLTFTPENYSITQAISFVGLPGSPLSEIFDVIFDTVSDDEAFDGLHDSWEYANVRDLDETVTVTTVVDGTQIINGTTTLSFPISGVLSTNTVITTPHHGSFSWQGESLIYNPTADYMGTDVIAYYLKDGTTVQEGRLYLTIQGTAPQPEMDITGNAIAIASGDISPDIADGTDFGDVLLLSALDFRIFAITNTGDAQLNLTGTPAVTISGTNSDKFSIFAQPSSTSIAPGGTTTFRVAFNPDTEGLHTATVNINNSDIDENPYSFAIQGTGNVAEGDVNGDGTINLTDLILSLQITGGISPTGSIYSTSDINADQKIGLAESIYILNNTEVLEN